MRRLLTLAKVWRRGELRDGGDEAAEKGKWGSQQLSLGLHVLD
jgi:hypothetical protein